METLNARIQLKYSDKANNPPTPETLSPGEIALNRADEKLYFTNKDNKIVSLGAPTKNLFPVTYNELKKLRDEELLVEGAFYRITDFVTTVANDDEARSAGHPFDLVILAMDNKTLQEECYAILHNGDNYFKGSNLNAWKIWYCIDNDTTRFLWADSENGKGVIYRMIDEWQNDCPYDFKNVQFKRYYTNGIDSKYNDTINRLKGYYAHNLTKDIFTEDGDGYVYENDFLWCYTFTRFNHHNTAQAPKTSQSDVLDDSISAKNLDYDTDDNKLNSPDLYNYKNRCSHNVFKSMECGIDIDGNKYKPFCLLNNVLYSTVTDYSLENNIIYSSPYGNTFGVNCFGNTFGSECIGNTFGKNCQNNIIDNHYINNITGNNFTNNIFGKGCKNNSFGSNFIKNQCGNYCENNSFGSNCNTCRFKQKFRCNTVGNNVSHILTYYSEVMNVNILSGTVGDSVNGSMTSIKVEPQPYHQFVELDDSKKIRIWDYDSLKPIIITWNTTKRELIVSDKDKKRGYEYGHDNAFPVNIVYKTTDDYNGQESVEFGYMDYVRLSPTLRVYAAIFKNTAFKFSDIGVGYQIERLTDYTIDEDE